MADRTPVKDELERKKQKLEEMRKRKAELAAKGKKMDGEPAAATAAANTAGSTAAGASAKWSNADDIFKELGLADAPLSNATQPPSRNLSSQLAGDSGSDLSAPQSLAPPRASQSAPARNVKLEIGKCSQIDIAAVEMNAYQKETQTDFIEPEPQNDLDQEDLPPIEVKTEVKDEPLEPQTPTESKPPVVKQLAEEDKEQIINSEDFLTFFTRTTKFVERELDEKDYLKTYVKEDAGDSEQQPGNQVKVSRSLFQERWCKNSVVTSMDWSPFHPRELILGSYRNLSDEVVSTDADGTVLVWNLMYHSQTPDFIYQCQSSVTQAKFAKFHPNLVVGGTYSGQVVIWDSRNHKRTPVQRTPLSAQAHTHPVFCVDVIGTENAHNLLTISSDGKLCSWSMDMLSQPQESLELMSNSKSAAKQWLTVKCMSFPTNDYNSFVVGSEDGYIYMSVRHGQKPGITQSYERHFAPVTAVDFNHCPGQIDFGHLFISSSFDWSAKLWSTRCQRPLHSFEGLGEYVTCVEWSPVHPALFASTQCAGRLDLWDLNHDTEVAVSSLQLDGGPAALSQCRWSATGKQIALGDDEGSIHIVDIGDNICYPEADTWTSLVSTLTELQSQSSEMDQLSTDPSAVLNPMPY